MSADPQFRSGTLEDVPVLAELVNYAGEGLPHYLWGQTAGPGETPWDVGHNRAAREEGSFSYRNATMIEKDGHCAGCLIGYEIPDRPEPIPDDMPTLFVPLQELENLAPGTWYVNVLAVRPQYRGQGLGTRLLWLAEEKARSLRRRGLSVIVSDANAGARQLYERCGYAESAKREMVKEEWDHHGHSWILLTNIF